MLLLVTGSSCSGKSTATAAGCGDLAGVSVRDSDEHGVPSDADTAWRQRDLGRWVTHALTLSQRGTDLVLTAQSPIGELLASPDADGLDLAVCLVDVADAVRSERLEHREPGKWSAEAKQDFNGWAGWHRAHARDPRHHPEVITRPGAPGQRWDRWQRWDRHDPRWGVASIDTTGRSVSDTAAAVRGWVLESRASRDAGRLPLARGWCPATPPGA
ncbi:hypothetical protein GCM10009868_33400 [Terrabacter aerolatus]|uniref:Uncharacterized protein n=1 Tax=Terrabacter aerolatus TaxID=422442 RepID=A0A512D6Y5_9MICO|nr:hypothetical protein [Terrabacter aerolatus]GEO32243.1 hypothetical protein TAE01_40530 [Terrabacter aerolatus]